MVHIDTPVIGVVRFFMRSEGSEGDGDGKPSETAGDMSRLVFEAGFIGTAPHNEREGDKESKRKPGR